MQRRNNRLPCFLDDGVDRPCLRGQPDPQARAHRDAVATARTGDVRLMAGGNGRRSDQCAGQPQSLPDIAKAV
ncbi:hypothetical protein XcuCFBP2542_18745 [Xanthomonas cucurbitae]|uniref:Uncharacterized protein n=1 Tax=Xanthomonas cucurbitae TaxID=56453 RepID=A0A2S7D9J8_9XANT|nr:hypothetical protein XcuCFBP2542_18745 [Xanthomonas cucurbitae]